jgi:hypothetical protein
MNTVYRALMLARAGAAVGAAEAVRNIKHPSLKGQLREIVIRDLFCPLLPSDVGVGTGEIISADNRHSKEQDIVIFDKRILPPMVFESAMGVFPIESVLYAIEVKSKMTANDIRTSDKSATELIRFMYQSGDYDESGKSTEHTVDKVASCVFAFETDLTLEGKSEIERYDEIRDSKYDPALRAICVVGRGYWYWHKDQWITWERTSEFEEIVGFITSIMNTYREVAATRKEPRLHVYLTDK